MSGVCIYRGSGRNLGSSWGVLRRRFFRTRPRTAKLFVYRPFYVQFILRWLKSLAQSLTFKILLFPFLCNPCERRRGKAGGYERLARARRVWSKETASIIFGGINTGFRWSLRAGVCGVTRLMCRDGSWTRMGTLRLSLSLSHTHTHTYKEAVQITYKTRPDAWPDSLPRLLAISHW